MVFNRRPCLQEAMQHEQELLWLVRYFQAAAGPSVSLSEMQQWLQDQTRSWPYEQEACAAAAADGRLDVLRLLQARIATPLDPFVWAAAAGYGHLPIIQWLCSQCPPWPWTEQAVEAAGLKGHADVLGLLLNQQLPFDFFLLHPQAWPLNTRECLASWYPPSEEQHWDKFSLLAACAARGRRRDVLEWVLSLNPVFKLETARVLVIEACTAAINFMHDSGCLEVDKELQAELIAVLNWPAVAGDLVCLKELKDVLTSHGAILQAGVNACFGRKMFAQATCGKAREVILNYWKDRAGKPDYVAVAEWVMDSLDCEQQHFLWNHLCTAQNGLLAVEMKASRPGQYPDDPIWTAATHKFAAAHAVPSVLRYLVGQQGMPQEYTEVHADCSDARMLLLVHGHEWRIPAEVAGHLEAVERRRLAWYWAARQKRCRAGTRNNICRLPSELLKKIAWEADIDFSWSLFESGCP